MKAKIVCKTTEKGIQSFFVRIGEEEYFLFAQGYRKSNKLFFRNGVMIDDLGDFSGAHSTAVRNTLDKLPSYIRCVEKEYGLEIYSKNKKSKYRSLYKRENKRWQNYIWDIA